MRPAPVSYTHLDVYKRQALFPSDAENAGDGHMVLCPTGGLIAGIAGVHRNTDVYKRKNQYLAAAIRSGVSGQSFQFPKGK